MALPWLIGAAALAIGVAVKKALDSDDSNSDDSTSNDDEEQRHQQEQEAKKRRKRQNLEKKIVNLEQEFYTGLPDLIINSTKALGLTPKSKDLEASIKAVFPMQARSQLEEEIESYRQAIEKDNPSEYATFLKGMLMFSSKNALDSDVKLVEDFSNNILLLEKLLGYEISLEKEDHEAFIKMKNSIETLDFYSKIREELAENEY